MEGLCDDLTGFDVTARDSDTPLSEDYPRYIPGVFRVYKVLGYANSIARSGSASSADHTDHIATTFPYDNVSSGRESSKAGHSDTAIGDDKGEMDIDPEDAVMEDVDHFKPCPWYDPDVGGWERDQEDVITLQCGEERIEKRAYPLLGKVYDVRDPPELVEMIYQPSTCAGDLPDITLSDGKVVRPRVILLSCGRDKAGKRGIQYHCHQEDGAERDQIVLDQVRTTMDLTDGSLTISSMARPSINGSDATISRDTWDHRTLHWVADRHVGAWTTSIDWENHSSLPCEYDMIIKHFIPEADEYQGAL